MSFQVDPDALTAASKLASKQHEHIGTIDGYISASCSNFGAFSGVLSLFLGSYESAVSTAHDGLRDSQAVADKVRDAFIGSRDDYLATDEATYDRFRALSSDPSSFPPYDPAGSGNDTPGGPLSNAPADGTKLPDLEDKSPGLTDVGKKGLDQVKPGNDVDKPPAWMDPKKAAEDAIKDGIERRTDEYQYYRSLGYSDEEALEFAKTDNADGRADTINHDRINRNAETAYNTEYDRQIAAGASEEDARERANDAYADSRSTDSADHDRRRDIGSTASTYNDLYNEANKTVDGVKDLVDNVNEINDNADDLDEYDDYESQDEDESAQEWARS
ncbi:hypothetical protein SAMN04489844_1683 [Nocardioides exalbidus]|uniref:Excreted virulence factor EspC, type VII ESX diderm n=1 Tax=Nocardioides exalbidus TaxID=402596 RepID=A0A1H4PSR1_9ACTN|nr:hypothetical protein [Nocardioides exalbidus]SEC10331.1 hypothetical protein SAMN04489844_1683 [Nocardioides exalbidus]